MAAMPVNRDISNAFLRAFSCETLHRPRSTFRAVWKRIQRYDTPAFAVNEQSFEFIRAFFYFFVANTKSVMESFTFHSVVHSARIHVACCPPSARVY